jgi:SMI1/KNR4 family protein SUKH-1
VKKHLFERIAPYWFSKPGAIDSDIQQAESDLHLTLPLDYKQFLLWSNGGEGYIGSKYFSFWAIQELKELNASYRINHYLPEILGIGTDGGGECFALDFRSNPSAPAFVQIPLGDLDIESVTPIASSLQEGFEKALARKI